MVKGGLFLHRTHGMTASHPLANVVSEPAICDLLSNQNMRATLIMSLPIGRFPTMAAGWDI